MSLLPVGIGSSGGYEIEKSLRFRASASAYLSRTPGVAGNRRTWTWSGWVKRGAWAEQALFGAETGANDRMFIRFNSSDQLDVRRLDAGVSTGNVTSAAYRDPSAHYHVVVTADFAQASAANRAKIYVNGVQQTLTTAGVASGNSSVNNNVLHRTGYTASSLYFDGYLSEINFIDGQALDPTSFGEFDAVTGVWVPKRYTGTYGTNGFYLPFNDATSLSTLTEDRSGNGNNWTANNISLTAGSTYDHMEDTPTNNFAVLNPLDNAFFNSGVLSHANLYMTSLTAGSDIFALSSVVMISGAFYHELTAISNGGFGQGVIRVSDVATLTTIAARSSGTGGTDPYGTLGIAVDVDSGKVWLRNTSGSWVSGDPALGTSPSATFTPGTPVVFRPSASRTAGSNNSALVAVNFGQRPFAYTPPTGFQALCTKNTGAIPPISSGSFTGNANANGPFVWLAGTPDTMTINGNAVTWGTHADRLANGFKVRTSSASYNAAGSNTFSVASFVDDFTDPNRAKANP